MNLIIRLLVTGLLVAWAFSSYFDKTLPNPNQEIIDQVGYWAAGAIALAFFIFVGFYCKRLLYSNFWNSQR